MLLGFVLLLPACGGATTPKAPDPASRVRELIGAVRIGDLDAGGAYLQTGPPLDEDCLQEERRWWTRMLDSYGLELTLYDTAYDGQYALVPYRLTGPAARAATYLAGQYTLVRAADGWRIVDHELSPGITGPLLAPFRVRLPRARVGVDWRSSPPCLTVHLAADGRLWMDGQYVADANDLCRRLQEGMTALESGIVLTAPVRQPDGLSFFSLVIRADEASAWNEVASVLRTACRPDVSIYKVGFQVWRNGSYLAVPRVIEASLLDVRQGLWDEDQQGEPPLLVVELAAGGDSVSAPAATTVCVTGGAPVQLSGVALSDALRCRWKELGNDPTTLGVIRMAPGVGDRIPFRDVVSVIDALVGVGLVDVRFEGLACVPHESPR